MSIGSKKFPIMVMPRLRKTAVLCGVTVQSMTQQCPIPNKRANFPNDWSNELSVALP